MKMRRPRNWIDFITNPENEPAKVQYTTGDGDCFQGAIVQAWDVCGDFVAVWNPIQNAVWVRKSRLKVLSKGTVL